MIVVRESSQAIQQVPQSIFERMIVVLDVQVWRLTRSDAWYRTSDGIQLRYPNSSFQIRTITSRYESWDHQYRFIQSLWCQYILVFGMTYSSLGGCIDKDKVEGHDRQRAKGKVENNTIRAFMCSRLFRHSHTIQVNSACLVLCRLYLYQYQKVIQIP